MAGDEVELELSLAFGEQRAQDQPQRRAAFELRRDLLDREQIGEGILAPVARAGSTAARSPHFSR